MVPGPGVPAAGGAPGGWWSMIAVALVRVRLMTLTPARRLAPLPAGGGEGLGDDGPAGGCGVDLGEDVAGGAFVPFDGSGGGGRR